MSIQRRVARIVGLFSLTVGSLAVGYGLAHFAKPSPAVLAPDSADAESITFFAVGRQGYNPELSTSIARGMERLAEQTPPHFLVFGGDNFYPKGVASVDDPQWCDKFEDVYAGAHLRGTPTFAVLGNHDLLGNVDAQVEYARLRRGSARWHMDGRWYARDFGMVKQGDETTRVLVRIVFLDMVSMLEDTASGLAQTQFLRDAMAAPGDPVWKVVVGHNPLRSLTEQPTALTRVMDDLRGVCTGLGVDLAVSSNDWFQQLIDTAEEPISISTSGGGRALEDVPTRSEPGDYTKSQRGFARVTLDAVTLTVDLLDERGDVTFSATRTK